MSQIPSAVDALTPSLGLESASARNTNEDLRDVQLDEFLQLLITELQNQDPLSPLENSEILQQISQIREIGATNQLTDTLDAVLVGQNLATASGLIGKEVRALTEDGTEVEGVVDKVSVETSAETAGSRSLRVHVGQTTIPLSNVSEIRPVTDSGA